MKSNILYLFDDPSVLAVTALDIVEDDHHVLLNLVPVIPDLISLVLHPQQHLLQCLLQHLLTLS